MKKKSFHVETQQRSSLAPRSWVLAPTDSPRPDWVPTPRSRGAIGAKFPEGAWPEESKNSLSARRLLKLFPIPKRDFTSFFRARRQGSPSGPRLADPQGYRFAGRLRKPPYPSWHRPGGQPRSAARAASPLGPLPPAGAATRRVPRASERAREPASRGRR